MEELRAEWFRCCCRFARYEDLTDRRTIWESWSQWCSSRGHDAGSKQSLWNWLEKIGAKRFERCNWAFRRIKML